MSNRARDTLERSVHGLRNPFAWREMQAAPLPWAY
jgi:hypothetical protein